MGERSLNIHMSQVNSKVSVFGSSLYPNNNPIFDPYKKLIFQIYFNTGDNQLNA